MGKSNSITIRFGKKDADLLSWLTMVPPSQFSSIVRRALSAFLEDAPLDLGRVVVMPFFAPKRKSLVLGAEYTLRKWKEGIPAPLLSDAIKNILRKYIVFVIPKPNGDYVPSFFPNLEYGQYQFTNEKIQTPQIFFSPQPSTNPENKDEEFPLLHEIAERSRFKV